MKQRRSTARVFAEEEKHLDRFSNLDSSAHLTTTTTSGKVIPVTIVAWSCTDRHIATAYENGLIKIWEPSEGTFLNELKVRSIVCSLQTALAFFFFFFFARNMNERCSFWNFIQPTSVYCARPVTMDFWSSGT